MTRRDTHVPAVVKKALAVVGVRRAGKTSFLWQCLGERLAGGRPRESMFLLGLEDDRLTGLEVSDLDWLVEEYFRRYPGLRSHGPVTICFDEIQTVPNWERFARRLADTEQIELYLSGSSAKLLSREVATALRGRAMEVLVHPFSFREALRHAGVEPSENWVEIDKAGRSALDNRLREYLRVGGFPEAQGVAERDRMTLLRGYVDVVVLRDVIERHAVSNPVALRWLQRQLLSTPGGNFSVQKFLHALKSQGIPVGKDTLHDYLAHLEDTFLVRIVSLHTASERQRMVNPRKAYPVDPGLIAAYERTGRSHIGHALETAVLLELERRGYEAAYYKTKDDREVDFFASAAQRPPLMIQVCADPSDGATLDRELRALISARAEHRGTIAQLVTLDAALPPAVPDGVQWWPASRWLLETETERALPP